MVTYDHFGADEHTQYEIGSLTKTFTALLLADAIRRGEVTADTEVGALLPLDGAPIADVALAELASHRSGLSTQGIQLAALVSTADGCTCGSLNVCAARLPKRADTHNQASAQTPQPQIGGA